MGHGRRPVFFCHIERSRDILPGILRVLYSQPDPSISVGMTKNAAFNVHSINKSDSPESTQK